MNNRNTVLAVKYTAYTLLLILLYVLQTTHVALTVRGLGPNFVVPAAIAIAMHEGELAGGILGMVAGLLCDLTGPLLFGFNGFVVGAFCILSGLLILHLLRCNLLGCMLFVLVTMLVRGSLEFLFGYGMWGYEGVSMIYRAYTLPTVIYTLVFTPPLYLAVRSLYRRFDRLLHR